MRRRFTAEGAETAKSGESGLNREGDHKGRPYSGFP